MCILITNFYFCYDISANSQHNRNCISYFNKVFQCYFSCCFKTLYHPPTNTFLFLHSSTSTSANQPATVSFVSESFILFSLQLSYLVSVAVNGRSRSRSRSSKTAAAWRTTHTHRSLFPQRCGGVETLKHMRRRHH